MNDTNKSLAELSTALARVVTIDEELATLRPALKEASAGSDGRVEITVVVGPPEETDDDFFDASDPTYIPLHLSSALLSAAVTALTSERASLVALLKGHGLDVA